MNASVTSIDQIKSTVIDLAIRFGPKVLVALLILFGGFMVARWVSGWLARALSRIELEPPVRSLLARIGWLLTFALFLVMALQNLGVELLPALGWRCGLSRGHGRDQRGRVGNFSQPRNRPAVSAARGPVARRGSGSLTADAAAKVSGQVPAQQPRFLGGAQPGGKESGLRAASAAPN
jgi:hypothetical protein